MTASTDPATATGEQSEIVASPAALLPIREAQLQAEIDDLRKRLDEALRERAILHAAYLDQQRRAE